jgi:hypothetical protein
VRTRSCRQKWRRTASNAKALRAENPAFDARQRNQRIATVLFRERSRFFNGRVSADACSHWLDTLEVQGSSPVAPTPEARLSPDDTQPLFLTGVARMATAAGASSVASRVTCEASPSIGSHSSGSAGKSRARRTSSNFGSVYTVTMRSIVCIAGRLAPLDAATRWVTTTVGLVVHCN